VQKGQISEYQLAASLIMCNKILEKSTMEKVWEEVKMLDILEFAHEKGLIEGEDIGLKKGKDIGLKEGKDLGLKEGKDLGFQQGVMESLIVIREIIIDDLNSRFDFISGKTVDMIKSISHLSTLNNLRRKVKICSNLEEFERVLEKAIEEEKNRE